MAAARNLGEGEPLAGHGEKAPNAALEAGVPAVSAWATRPNAAAKVIPAAEACRPCALVTSIARESMVSMG